MANGRSFQAIVDGEFTFDAIDGALDIIPTGKEKFHIIRNNQSYNAELIAADYNNKTFEIKVRGKAYHIKLNDDYDLLVKRLGLQVAAQQKVKDIIAPMPGLVLEVSVEPGQEVKEGSPLLILEAMKMENVIKCPADCVIKSIHVSKGEAVEKNYLLIEME